MQDKHKWTDKEVKHAWGDLETMLAKEMPVAAEKKGSKTWRLAALMLLSFVMGILVMMAYYQNSFNKTSSILKHQEKVEKVAQGLQIMSIDRFNTIDLQASNTQSNDSVKPNHTSAIKEQVSQHIQDDIFSNKHSQLRPSSATKPLVQGLPVDQQASQVQYEKTTSNDQLDQLKTLELNRLDHASSLHLLLSAVPTIRNRVSHVFVDMVNSSNLSKDLLGLRTGVGIETKLSKNTSWIKAINYEFAYHHDVFTETRLNDGRTTAPAQPGEEEGMPPKYIQVDVERYHISHAFGLMSGIRYKLGSKLSIASTLGVDYIASVSTHEDGNVLSANAREYLTNNDAINNWQFLSHLSTDYWFSPSFSLGLNLEYQYKPLFKDQLNIERPFDLADALSVGLRTRYLF